MTTRPSMWLVGAIVALAPVLATSSASAEPPVPPPRAAPRLVLAPPLSAQSAFRRGAPAAAPAAADPWWGPDKALHFSFAALLAGGGYALGSIVTDDPVGRAALVADFALSAALAKEAFDEAGLGAPSWRDFTWSVLGTALGVTVSIAIDLGVEKSKAKGR